MGDRGKVPRKGGKTRLSAAQYDALTARLAPPETWDNHKCERSLTHAQKVKLRPLLAERDGTDRCVICNAAKPPNRALAVDHADGHKCNNNTDNLRLLCDTCNDILREVIKRRRKEYEERQSFYTTAPTTVPYLNPVGQAAPKPTLKPTHSVYESEKIIPTPGVGVGERDRGGAGVSAAGGEQSPTPGMQGEFPNPEQMPLFPATWEGNRAGSGKARAQDWMIEKVRKDGAIGRKTLENETAMASKKWEGMGGVSFSQATIGRYLDELVSDEGELWEEIQEGNGKRPVKVIRPRQPAPTPTPDAEPVTESAPPQARSVTLETQGIAAPNVNGSSRLSGSTTILRYPTPAVSRHESDDEEDT